MVGRGFEIVKTRRYRSENVRTSRGRKVSSTRWLRRQLNDPFVKEAKANGYRCRAAFKIIEIDQKYGIFRENMKVLDLGSAPGGWSQVIVKRVGLGNVVAVDVQDMLPIEGVKFVKKDLMASDARNMIAAQMDTRGFNVVTSDMAPNASGDREIDHMRTIELAGLALDFAVDILEKNGSFISKIFHGIGENEFVSNLKKYFEKVDYFKPKSSRKESPEIYILARHFKIH
jgi:23S rRNA (uridine2552-2'-O)-methyltransferase